MLFLHFLSTTALAVYYLVRHAEVDGALNLNEQGKKRAVCLAKEVFKGSLLPPKIVSVNVQRCKQTVANFDKAIPLRTCSETATGFDEYKNCISYHKVDGALFSIRSGYLQATLIGLLGSQAFSTYSIPSECSYITTKFDQIYIVDPKTKTLRCRPQSCSGM
jgi:hypothetical protein